MINTINSILFIFLACIFCMSITLADKKSNSLFNAETIYYFCGLTPKVQIQEKDWIDKHDELDFLTFENLQDWREVGLYTCFLGAVFDSSVNNQDICPPKRGSFSLIISAYQEYYENNPESKTYSAATVAEDAFKKKFKCE